VIQVSENSPANWNLALNNARNIQNDVGKDKVELEIVAFGPGINMLKADAEVANRVTEAVESGIQVVACQNTMRNQKLSISENQEMSKICLTQRTPRTLRERRGQISLRSSRPWRKASFQFI